MNAPFWSGIDYRSRDRKGAGEIRNLFRSLTVAAPTMSVTRTPSPAATSHSRRRRSGAWTRHHSSSVGSRPTDLQQLPRLETGPLSWLTKYQHHSHVRRGPPRRASRPRRGTAAETNEGQALVAVGYGLVVCQAMTAFPFRGRGRSDEFHDGGGFEVHSCPRPRAAPVWRLPARASWPPGRETIPLRLLCTKIGRAG